MILLIDNYDSFTFNLVQVLRVLGAEVEVVRNDALTVDEALAKGPEALIFSPGPGRPEGAGLCLDLLAALPPELPFLGVCLGHQSLVLHEGGSLEVDAAPVHGKSSPVEHDQKGLFAGLPSPLELGRYHSLRAQAEDLPASLVRSAWTAEGLVMGVRHRELPRYGVQFHPESILSPRGPELMANFLRLVGQEVAPSALEQALAAVGSRPEASA